MISAKEIYIIYSVGLIFSFISFYAEVESDYKKEKDRSSLEPLKKKIASLKPYKTPIMERSVWYFLLKYFLLLPLGYGLVIFIFSELFGNSF